MRYISFLITAVLITLSVPFSADAYSARAMVLMETATDTVLIQKNGNTRLPMASTTKIMTALVVLENAELDTVVSIPDKAVGVEGSSMYLKNGERLSIRDLLYGLMLTSGNDAATALAIAVGGDEQSFVSMMNDKAKSLGLENTSFKNPSGLPDDDHYTTAFELAKITDAALENPVFSEIAKTKTKTVGNRTLSNHNKLLHLYDGAVGVKTGFTKKAGRCLVGAATRDGVTLVCVTLNDGDDWNDHITAFDYGFEQTDNITLCEKDEISVSLNTPDGKTVYANNRETLTAVTVGESIVTQKIIAEKFVYPPKTAGDTVGKIVFYINGKEAGESALCLKQALEAPPLKKQSFLKRIINIIKGIFKCQN